MHLSIKKVHFDNPTIKHDSVKLSESELKSLQYIIGYVVHKLYSKFKFSKIKIVFILNSVCQYCCAMLCCKIDSNETQTLINAKD